MLHAILPWLCFVAIPDDPTVNGSIERPAERRPTDRAAIERLIARLHSPNRDPNPKKEPFVRYPKDYDLQAQRRVEAARRDLIELGIDAFPVLIEHLNDKAYSQSVEASVLLSRSVGDVCFWIVQDQIDPVPMRYKMRLGADGGWHGFHSYSPILDSKGASRQESLRKWWNGNKNQSLQHIQQEAIRWHIRREEEIGFPEPKDREEYIDPLTKMLKELSER